MSKVNKNLEAIYPLSPTQKGMLFHKIYDENSQEYFEQLSCTFTGKIDFNAFQNAWQTVIDRNPILRTSFIYKRGKKIVQVVHKDIKLPLLYEDWSSFSQEKQQFEFNNLCESEKEKGINLSKAPLLRLFLIKTSAETHKFLWNHHHIILDGWSLPLVLNEVFKFYEAYRQGVEIDLPESRPYKDYITWLQNQDEKEAERFWKNYLSGFTAPTSLVIDNLEVINENSGFIKHKTEVDIQTSELINTLVKNNQITLSSFLQSVWAIILHKYSSEKDIVFGTTFSGRPTDLAESSSIIGLFINTLPVRAKINSGQSIIQWIKDFHAQQSKIRDYEYTPLYDIQKWSDIPAKESLFKSIFVFENYPIDESLKETEYSIKISDVESFEKTNFPITIVSGPGKSIPIEIAFDSSLIDIKLIDNLLNHFKSVITQIANYSNRSVGEIILPADNQSTLNTRNLSTIFQDNYINDLVEEFELNVKKHPNAIAVKTKLDEITFEELNNRSNYLASILIDSGIVPEDKVGIFVHRSIEMIVSIWAVLKAGAAYVPIDSKLPDKRIQFIINDAEIKLILTTQQLKETIPDNSVDKILTDELDKPNKYYRNPKIRVDELNLAYVIYTSGSTGKPKGTLLTRRGLQNYISWCLKTYPINEGRGSVVHSTLAFDATITAVFPSLLRGKTVYLVPENNEIEDLSKTLLEYKDFSLIKITPAHMELLSNQIRPEQLIGLTKSLVIGGENLTSKHIEFWQNNSPETLLFNEYGPTETVVGSVVFESSKWKGSGSVPIGHEIINTDVYVLDNNLNEMPIGIPGQLYISSIDIARGYLNSPDLTAEKFIPNPFLNVAGCRMYSTGDLVRQNLDGGLEFLGRIDNQVKIRGYRIELSEIEQVLNDHSNIKTAVVLSKEIGVGKNELVAYIRTEDEKELSVSEIRDYVSKSLPDYMVPSYTVFVNEIPLTNSGKIDTKKLVELEMTREGLKQAYIAPRDSSEELIAALVKDILKIDKVGMMDEFFELGGHSLSAAQLVARVRDIFSIDLPIKAIFDSNNIAELAEVVNSIKRENLEVNTPVIEKKVFEGNTPLSYPQSRLWFIDQFDPVQSNYNIPTVITLKGGLNYQSFEKAIQKIVERHEVLRSSFKSNEGKPFVEIADQLKFSLMINDITSLNESDRAKNLKSIIDEKINTVFDLSQAPLFKIDIIKTDENKHVFILILHHIISDGWSSKIMIEEMANLYNSYISGEDCELQPLEIQYSDYAYWQNEWLKGDTLDNKISFWKSYLADIPVHIELPADFKRPSSQTFNGSTISFDISSDLTDMIGELSKREGLTNFMILLTAYQILLSKYSRQDDVVVGTPVANRMHTKLEKVIGFFANTVPIRSKIENEGTLLEQLKITRKNALDAFTYGDLPFEYIVDAIQPERNMSHSPIFQVAFVFQNTSNEHLLLNGIEVSNHEFENKIAKYDLTLYTIENEGKIRFSVEFNTDLFYSSTIKRMIRHFINILEKITTKPKTKISHLNILGKNEFVEQVIDSNQSETELDYNKCIQNVFEERVNQYSQELAISYSEYEAETLYTDEVSYTELNRNANKLANYLIRKGVGPEKIVAVSLPRSIELITSILAVLKAGAAFLPVDPFYPEERIKFMLDDSDCFSVITQSILSDAFTEHSEKVIYLDKETDLIYNENDENISAECDSSNLAYVIYTSGTTGKPKGTLLQHEGAINLAKAQKENFNITEASKILQFSSLSFDAFVWESVMALLNGASLNLVSQEMINSSELLVKTIKALAITTITIPPSVLGVIDEQESEELNNLKTIIVAGEKCTAELAKRWRKNRQFVNAYGPTETTVCASMFHCPEECEFSPPIGKPLNNFELYILDKNLNPVPEGVIGELYISGISLARGYHKQPSLTASKFVPNPFSKGNGKRMYKSGDLVKRLNSGDIDYVGRIDNQVKLRGFRIELSEIESVLSSYTTIKESVVIVREDNPGNQQLIAYVVMKNGNEMKIPEIKSFLRRTLPDYMIPVNYIKLVEFPLTPSKKVDYKLLPKPDSLSNQLTSEYIEPTTDDEIIISDIGKELLGVDKIGIHDNFFELGLHSLLATQFVSRVKTRLKKEITLKTLFEHPTIADISNVLAKTDELIENDENVIKSENRGDADLMGLIGQLENMSDDEAKELLEKDEETKS